MKGRGEMYPIIGYTIILAFIILLINLTFNFLVFRRPKKMEDDKFEIAGFAYDPNQDIFYSVLDAWQREYGYCHLYDEASTIISLVVDAEPIIFEYDNKLWLIEFWKGQYGMTSGAEIGIYNAPITKNKKSHFFNSITDEEMLDMSYTLFKNDEYYFKRQDKHWWLTGFKLGDFVNPEDLRLYVTINFKDLDMAHAFIKELIRIGYQRDKISIHDTKVSVIFDKPYSKQPCTRNKFLINIAQSRNKMFVDRYKELTINTDNITEKANLIKEKDPKLYKKINNIGFSKGIYSLISHLKIRKSDK
jgi:hypothetical protein